MRPMHFRAPIAALLTVCACASAPPPRSASHASVPARAALEVVNRTALSWEIALNGWTLGVVPPGDRRIFRHLRPGDWPLSAHRPLYTTKRHRTQGVAARTTVWEILPPPDRTPLAVPPALGAIRVRNPTERDLLLQVDDGPVRSLLAGDTRRLDDIPAGTRSLHVRAPGTRYHRAVPVAVLGGEITAVEAPVEVGRLEVSNTTGEAVRILIDGIERRTVADRVVARIDDLLVGVHDLRAVGAVTRRESLRRVEIAADAVLEWDLSAASGRVRLRNRTGERLALAVDGAPRGELATGADASFEDIPLGRRLVTAEGKTTSYRWSAELPVVAGHARTWTIREDAGTLRVRNELQDTLEVRLGGRVLGTVPPDAERFFDDIPGGKQAFSVFGRRSKRIVRRTLDVTPAESVTWEVRTPEARLHVRNRTPEDVIVYADRRPLGRVKSGEELVFTQLPTGDRLLEARGVVSKEVNRQARTFAEDVQIWDIARSAGRVRIVNASGETLVARPGLLGRQGVASGATADVLLPVGHRILHLIGQRSGESYHKRLEIRADETLEWRVGALSGVLHVFNRTAEAQRVAIDGGEPFLVSAGKDRRVTLPIGRHRIVAVGERTKNAGQGTVRVRNASSHPWEIVPGLASVRIENKTPEIVDVRRDGEPLGFVEADGMRTFGPWPAGDRTLTAQGRWSRAIYEVQIDLRPGRVEAWTLVPARGALLVSNRRDEDVRVLPANQQVRIEVPLGKRLVELIGRDSHATFVHRVRVRPDRTYSVDAPAGPAELIVANRLAIALTLRIDGVDRGVVEPQGETRIPLPFSSKVDVYAVAPGSRLRWHRRLKVADDRVHRWEITE